MTPASLASHPAAARRHPEATRPYGSFSARAPSPPRQNSGGGGVAKTRPASATAAMNAASAAAANPSPRAGASVSAIPVPVPSAGGADPGPSVTTLAAIPPVQAREFVASPRTASSSGVPAMPLINVNYRDESMYAAVNRNIAKSYRSSGFDSYRGAPELESFSDRGLSTSAREDIMTRGTTNRRLSTAPRRMSERYRKTMTPQEVALRWKQLQYTDFQKMSMTDRGEMVGELMQICDHIHGEFVNSQAESQFLKEKLRIAEQEIRKLTQLHARDQQELRAYDNPETFDGSAEGIDRLLQYHLQLQQDLQKYESVSETDRRALHDKIAATRAGLAEVHGPQVISGLLKSFESLLFALKKRLAKFEENALMKTVLDQYGNLQNLLDENERLKRDNLKLRSREVRFEQQPLLQRRNWADCDRRFLRLTIIALQNELSAARRLIQSFNLEENPTLGLLVHSPEPFPTFSRPQNLEHLCESGCIDDIFPGLLDDWDPNQDPLIGDFPAELTVGAELVEQLESENEGLRARVEALERMLHLTEEVRGSPNLAANNSRMRSSSNSIQDPPSSTGKLSEGVGLRAAKRRHYRKVNEDLIAELERAQRELSENKNMAETNAELAKEYRIRNEALHKQNLRLSKSNLVKEKQTRQAHLYVRRLASLLRATHLANVKLAHDVASRNRLPESKAAHLVTYYRDTFTDVYFRATFAAIRIQAWFRGIRIRRALQQIQQVKGGKVSLPHHANYWEVLQDEAVPRKSRALMRGQDGEGSGKVQKSDDHFERFSPSRAPATLAGVLDVVLHASERDTLFLAQVPDLLRQARLDTLQAVRHQVIAYNRLWAEQMKMAAEGITAVLKNAEVVPPEMSTAFSQTTHALLASSETQFENFIADESNKQSAGGGGGGGGSAKKRPGGGGSSSGGTSKISSSPSKNRLSSYK